MAKKACNYCNSTCRLTPECSQVDCVHLATRKAYHADLNFTGLHAQKKQGIRCPLSMLNCECYHARCQLQHVHIPFLLHHMSSKERKCGMTVMSSELAYCHSINWNHRWLKWHSMCTCCACLLYRCCISTTRTCACTCTCQFQNVTVRHKVSRTGVCSAYDITPRLNQSSKTDTSASSQRICVEAGKSRYICNIIISY